MPISHTRIEQRNAALRVAVSRSKRTGTAETGFNHLKRWGEDWPGLDPENLILCFRKWARRFAPVS